MKSILIIHTWGVGDWMFFTPVLKALKQSYPEIRIDVIVGTPGTKNIIDLYPEVRVIGVTDVRKGPLGMLLSAVRTWPKKYDALVFTAGMDSRKADKLALLIRAAQKAALTTGTVPRFINLFAPYDESLHRVENNVTLARLLGMDLPFGAAPYVPSNEKVDVVAGSLLIHPGSDAKNSFKRWPADRFAAVAEAALHQGRRVSVVLGLAEVDVASAFYYLEAHDKFKLYRGLTPREVVRAIALHETFLNSDSGLGHIAAAIGSRIISIVGPGDPVTVRPYTARSVVMKTSRTLKCMPCIRPGGLYGCKDRQCLDDISVERILEVL